MTKAKQLKASVDDNSVDLFGALGNEEVKKRTLKVTEFKVVGESCVGSVEELFAGFDYLKVITYSSSVGLLKQLLPKFKEIEMIFGNEKVVGAKYNEIMEYQYALCKELNVIDKNTDKALSKGVEEGKLSFWITRYNDHTSHEKVFLLEAEDGRFRTIVGSANFSFTAFGGKQLENIMVSNSEATFRFYEAKYEETKSVSSQKLDMQQVHQVKEPKDFDKLPINAEVKEVKSLILETGEEAYMDVFIAPKDKLEGFAQFLGDFKEAEGSLHLDDIAKDNAGKVVITYESLRKVKKLADEKRSEELELRKHITTFKYDLDNNILLFNGDLVDIKAEAEDIKRDVNIVMSYFANFKGNGDFAFVGNVESGIRKYWATLNFAFCSPFIAPCRYTANLNKNSPMAYPLFLILKGGFNGGKSELQKFLCRLMYQWQGFNVDTSSGIFADKDGSTPAAISKKMFISQGACLMVDDLDNDTFKKWGEYTIKNRFELNPNVSPVIVSGNRIKVVKKDIFKRVGDFDILMEIPNDANYRVNNLGLLNESITGGLYKEYLARMCRLMPEFLASIAECRGQIEDSELENVSVIAKKMPDVLEKSSEILMGIFAEYADSERFLEYAHLCPVNYYIGDANKDDLIEELVKLYTSEGKEWKLQGEELVVSLEKSYEAEQFYNKYSILKTGMMRLVNRTVYLNIGAVKEVFGIEVGEAEEEKEKETVTPTEQAEKTAEAKPKGVWDRLMYVCGYSKVEK